MEPISVDYVLMVKVEMKLKELKRFRELLDDVREDFDDVLMIEKLDNIIGRAEYFERDSKIILGHF